MVKVRIHGRVFSLRWPEFEKALRNAEAPIDILDIRDSPEISATQSDCIEQAA